MDEGAPIEGDLQLEAADTLLGQLQRGRGLGYLRALREGPGLVHPLIINCMIHDPRWDTQIESRADYYARLALATRLELAPLEGYLHNLADDRLDSAALLTLATLGRLGLRGAGTAIQLLREYVSYGTKWDAALQELAELPDPEAVNGLADVICSRFATGQLMDHSSVYEIFLPGPLDRVWKEWSQTHPCISRLLDQITEMRDERSHQQHEPIVRPNYKTLTVDELLAQADAGNRRNIEKALLSRLQHAEVGRYAAAFSTDNPFAWSIAFECLAAMKRAAPYYGLILSRVLTYLETTQIRPGQAWARTALERVLQQLPCNMTLPVARRWYMAPEWYLRLTGEGVLEEHATTEDIPVVKDALSSALDSATPQNTDIYRICSALDILARFPNIGLLEEVETAFTESPYSYARFRAARAMSVNAPRGFADDYAYECLWDCGEETRELGCRSVSLNVAGARPQLRSLEEDPYEADTVRRVARQRLSSPPDQRGQ